MKPINNNPGPFRRMNKTNEALIISIKHAATGNKALMQTKTKDSAKQLMKLANQYTAGIPGIKRHPFKLEFKINKNTTGVLKVDYLRQR